MPAVTPRRRQSPLDRILGRVDDLDQASLAILVQRLAAERHLLETLFNTIQEGILVISADGVIEYSNRAANHLVGLDENDTGKAVIWKLIPGLARTLSHTLDADTPAPNIAREIEITYPEPRHVRLHLSRLAADVTPASRPRYLVILLDITADKISTENLVESERVNSIFTLAASVAHELGNPLNSIHIHLQLIQRHLAKLRSPASALARVGDSVRICAEEITRLDGIIHHFLEAIRPSPPQLQDVHLLATLAEVLTLLKTQCEDLGIRVTLNTPQDIPLVSGDKNQLKQLFFNILKNAMEAMDRGGRIDIVTESDDEYVHIHIRDTGAGIERDAMTRMFDPYYTTKKGGHGLGMMVVMRILRAHGGELGVESLPGRGTTVTIHFPQKHRRIRMLSST